jgi:hypothetical protein
MKNGTLSLRYMTKNYFSRLSLSLGGFATTFAIQVIPFSSILRKSSV